MYVMSISSDPVYVSRNDSRIRFNLKKNAGGLRFYVMEETNIYVILE
jgi:hypothetical protein